MATVSIGITGTKGFIGSNLKKYLLNKKIRFKVFSGDLLKESDITSFFEKHSITHIIHLVGSFEPPLQNLIKKNCLTTQSLLEIGRKYKLKKIIYASSGAVYGNSSKQKSLESDKLKPNTLYGLTKVFAEEIVKYYYQNFGISYVILRFPNVYGEGNYKGVIFHFTQDLKNKKEIIIHGDGKQKRNFLHVSDACEAIEKAIYYNKSDIFNISTQKSYSILEVVNLLSKKYKFSVKYKSAENDLENLSLDIQKARKLLKFSSNHDVKDFL